MVQRQTSAIPDLLLVEDEPAEIYLLEKAFASGPLPVHVHVATTGETALAFLRREGSYHQAPRPQLIITSLNLPGMGGLALVAALKRDQAFARIPVIVLTHYSLPEMITQSYALGANCYLVKPQELDALFALVHAMEEFWLKTATLSSL